MLSAALLLLCNSLFLSLHLTGSAGSFPKPLSAARERECLERCAAGDLEARNILVEHNLRLVAHIIKKYYTQSTDQEDRRLFQRLYLQDPGQHEQGPPRQDRFHAHMLGQV